MCVWYAGLAVVFLFLACLPFSHAVQNMQVRKAHFASHSFGSWAALQFAPSMYNFQNWLYISYAPLHEIDASQELAPTVILKVNHYPIHPMYMDTDRQRLISDRPLHLYAVTRYQGREWMTPCVLTSQGTAIHMRIGKTDEPPQR